MLLFRLLIIFFQNHEMLKDLLNMTQATPIKDHYWSALMLIENFWSFAFDRISVCEHTLLTLKSFT